MTLLDARVKHRNAGNGAVDLGRQKLMIYKGLGSIVADRRGRVGRRDLGVLDR